MSVFCAVKNDRLEHICFMADSLMELAELMHFKYCSVKHARATGRPIFGYKIIRVEIDDETEDRCA